MLVPPCTVSPFRSRALTLTSTPCQFSVCFAEVVRVLRELVEQPDLARDEVIQAADRPGRRRPGAADRPAP